MLFDLLLVTHGPVVTLGPVVLLLIGSFLGVAMRYLGAAARIEGVVALHLKKDWLKSCRLLSFGREKSETRDTEQLIRGHRDRNKEALFLSRCSSIVVMMGVDTANGT